MKTWILAAALLLASATAANADRLRCETISIIPGFTIQNCERINLHRPHAPYQQSVKRWNNDWRHRKGFSAGKHYRHDRNYYRGRWHWHPRKDHHRRHDSHRDYRW